MPHIRKLESPDIPGIVKGWNEVLKYDNVSECKFEEIILGDPNYVRDHNMIAVEDANIVGFVGAVAREGIVGRDGRGRPSEMDRGYIKALYFLNDHWGTGIDSSLLNEALKCLRSMGKRVVWFGIYSGRFFFPGTDIRYERLLLAQSVVENIRPISLTHNRINVTYI